MTILGITLFCIGYAIGFRSGNKYHGTWRQAYKEAKRTFFATLKSGEDKSEEK